MSSFNQEEFAWSVTLDKENPEHTWSSNDSDTEEYENTTHRLLIKNAYLSTKAQAGDALHVVEVQTTGFKDEKIHCPLAMFKGGSSVFQHRIDQVFNHDVTFTLAEGNGPVHLMGSHVLEIGLGMGKENSEDEEVSNDEGDVEEEEAENDEEMSEEDSPIKPPLRGPKKPSANGAGKRGKKRKANEVEDEEDSEEEEEEQVTKGPNKKAVNKKSKVNGSKTKKIK